jgi:Glycosyl hydrolase family 79 C-terminal beta domain
MIRAAWRWPRYGVWLIPDRKARTSRRGLLAALLLGTLIVGLLLGGSPGRSGAGSLRSPAVASAGVSAPAPGRPALGANRADVTVPVQARTIAIPRAFLGLSTEYATMPLVEQYAGLYERVLSALHVPGDGRFVLRIGGDSSDHAVFDQSADRLPPWAFPVTPALVARTVGIIKDLRLRVIIDLNTISTTPRLTGGWVRAAIREANLPAGSLAAFEIGNEPDIYNRATWAGNLLAANPPSTLKQAPLGPARLPKRITAASYARTYEAFARALASAAPHVPLVAPALAVESRHLWWISTLLHRPHPGLGVISAHVYPYSACAGPGHPLYPTVHKLLSENATAGMAKTIAPAVALAHKAGFSLRLTEINSVTCGGVKGVSNTFATALWAPDALFELMRAGVEGVNLHARVQSINDPFFFTRQGLQTHPLLYGLILFKRMLGAHARLVPVRLRSSRSLHLKVWAVREGEGTLNTLNVLLINKGRRSALINLHLPTRSQASVQRLLAPSASSNSDVTLAGQRLDDQAEWQGKAQLETISPTRRGYVVRVRGESAALLTVHVAASTLVAPPQLGVGPGPLFGYE